MVAYSGIGSRETPPEVISIMEDAGFRLARIGFILRSGKADGADAAFQRGAQRFQGAKCEIYIPWKGFKGGSGLIDKWDILPDELDRQYPGYDEMRWEWVKEVHGGWERLSQGARKLHERNIHQLFGPDLGNAYLNQSKFVLYYAPETKSGNPKGGTATCVNLARKQGIRTLNLLTQEGRDTLEKFLVSMEVKRGIQNGESERN